LNCTGYTRKYVVGIASDQANRTNHNYQNNGQHHRILGDVLALVGDIDSMLAEIEAGYGTGARS